MSLLSPGSDVSSDGASRYLPSPSPAPSAASSRTAPSPSPTTARRLASSKRRAAGSKAGSRTPSGSVSPPPPTRSQYQSYSKLLTSLAAREATELAPRLAGKGLWGALNPNTGPATGPTWATAPDTATATSVFTAASSSRGGFGQGGSEDSDELNSDTGGPSNAGTRAGTQPQLSAPPTPAPEVQRIPLAQRTVTDTDIATRWPLHPIELTNGDGALAVGAPLPSAVSETTARVIRRHRLALPASEGKLERRRFPRRTEAGREADRKRNRDADKQASVAPSTKSETVLDEYDDVDADFAIPAHLALAERVGTAIDRTLAGLAAFRPPGYAWQRDELDQMSWTSVVAAASMVVDREVVERMNARLTDVFALQLGSEGPAALDAAADTLRARLDAAAEATAAPRLTRAQLASELYTLPPYKNRVHENARGRKQRLATAAKSKARLQARAEVDKLKDERRQARHKKMEAAREERNRKTREKRRELRRAVERQDE